MVGCRDRPWTAIACGTWTPKPAPATSWRPQVVLVDPEQYDRMVKAAEELADIVAFDQAMAENGDNIPWEQALVDLGWV